MYGDTCILSSPHKTIIPAYRNTMTVMITLFTIFNRKHPRTQHKSLEATTQSPQKLFTIHVYFFVCLPKFSFNNTQFLLSLTINSFQYAHIAVHIFQSVYHQNDHHHYQHLIKFIVGFICIHYYCADTFTK